MMRKSAPLRFGSLRVRLPPATPGQRIGLIGGSFNPPHEGHRLIVQTALKRLGLDRLWVLVTPGNPLKSTSELAPLAERVAGCKRILGGPRVVITDLEAKLGTAFTAATLAFIARRYSRTRFVWIMGADNLPSFHRWQHWREIFDLMPVAVIDRPGCHLRGLASRPARAYSRVRIPEAQGKRLIMTVPPAWTMLTGPLSAASSTALRTPKTRLRKA